MATVSKKQVYNAWALTLDGKLQCEEWQKVAVPFVFHTKADAKGSKQVGEKVVAVKITFEVLP